ncbi:MAG TPA: CDP-alcohol phosphatidyltransferase family protein [Saprospiraceae bacterium]|nr:CDP-alcohol phosphatidyltransferase family protein [Saprospiraceae bacterium]HNT20333.1 CDP-alcohol phosphatidyltransferase family protein [Saprospiraceae bacterium]
MIPPQENEALTKLHFDLLLYSLWIIFFTFVSILKRDVFYLAITALPGFAYWVAKYFLNHRALHFPYGPANAVTLLRMTGLIAVTLIHPVIPDLLLGILFTLICLGDLLDGYLARTFKMTSTIGEYMDKETDALFVLCTTFILFQKGFTGVWIVSLGLIRYLYFIVVFYFLKPGRKEIKDKYARIIAVVVFVSILLCYFLPYAWSFPVLVFAAAALFISFGRGALAELGLLNLNR